MMPIVMRTCRPVGVAFAALVVGIALAGCAGGDDDVTSSDPTSDPSTTSTTTATETTPIAESGFCAIFADLAEQRGGRQGQARNADEAAWDRNLATVEHVARVAPEEIAAQADAYVQMVEDRRELAAANEWADVTELPADVRAAFIADHADLQRQVNELLAYAKASCPGMT